MRNLHNISRRKLILSSIVAGGAIFTVALANYLPQVINDVRQRAANETINHMLHAEIDASKPPLGSNGLAIESQFLKPGMTPIMTRHVTNSGVTISWNTTEPAKSQVEYGTTTSYGQATLMSTDLKTSHTQTLTGLQPGTTYNYRVVAMNAAGKISKSVNKSFTTMTDTNAVAPPKLLIKSPTNNQAIKGNVVDIAYTSTGNQTEVNHVHFHIDDGSEIMDTTFEGSYQLNMPLGAHKIIGYLVRSDHSKIAGSEQTINITLSGNTDTTPPTVALTGFSSTSVVGKINLQATASDNDKLAYVQFFVDGVQVGNNIADTPYSYQWDSFTVGNGTHTVVAKARDAAGNETSSSAVTITVQNDANASKVGKWAAPMSWPLVAVHATLLHTGEILLWDAWQQPTTQAKVWNPATNVFTSVTTGKAIFCAGHTQLPDGRIIVAGGMYESNAGINSTQIFNPVTKTWTTGPAMNYNRWYPTMTLLSNGSTLITSGKVTPSTWADTPEIYNSTTNTWTRLTAIKTPELREDQYPLDFHLPNGKVVSISSERKGVQIFDPNATTWHNIGHTTIPYGSAVQYQPGKILMSGGGTFNGNSVPNAAVIDFNSGTPTWRSIHAMNAGRYLHNFVVLPDGKVLAVGGISRVTAAGTTGPLSNELFDPATETWTTMASMQKTRLYHSTALLLPDARVLVSGGGYMDGAPLQTNAEMYSPAYLFQGARPAITSSPSEIKYGSNITVTTPDAAAIAKVSLISLGSVTHGHNMNQKYFTLTFQKGTNGLTITPPASSTIAPPGYYMLFLINSAGVPSVAQIVKVSESAVAQPTQAITPFPTPTPKPDETSSTIEDIYTNLTDSRVKLAASADATNGKITIKAQNTSSDSFTFSGSLTNISGITKLEQYVTSGTAVLAKKSDITVTNNSFTVTLEPESTVVLTAGTVPTPTPTMTIAPTITPTKAVTPTPSKTPTPTTTKIPSATPTSTPNLPTATLIPTPNVTQNPNATSFTLNVFLQGIGNGGDNANPNSQGNMAPLTPQKQITVEILNAQSQPVATKAGTITYQSTSGNFTGSVAVENINSGVYQVRLSTTKYLKKLVTGIVTVTKGTVVPLTPTTLILGDTNIDNRLSILDFNLLMDCYSDLRPAANCTEAIKKVNTDLNDDGKVNQIDLNLLLRQFLGQSGR